MRAATAQQVSAQLLYHVFVAVHLVVVPALLLVQQSGIQSLSICIIQLLGIRNVRFTCSAVAFCRGFVNATAACKFMFTHSLTHLLIGRPRKLPTSKTWAWSTVPVGRSTAQWTMPAANSGRDGDTCALATVMNWWCIVAPASHTAATTVASHARRGRPRVTLFAILTARHQPASASASQQQQPRHPTAYR